MNLKKLFLMLTVFVLLGTTAFAQVYVDVTNGSDTYSGANPTNNPAGTGPKATFAAARAIVTNGGTIVVKAGTYPEAFDLTTSLLAATNSYTIKFSQLNGNNDVNFTGAGAATINKADLIVTVTTDVGTEKGNLTATTFNLSNGTVNLTAASALVLANNTTLNLSGTSGFMTAAPTKGANLSLAYAGGSDITAGLESAYGTYGTGIITVAKTAGTTVTFPNAINPVSGIVVTSGNATFSNSLNINGSTTDVVNSGTGTLTLNGAVTMNIWDATGDANLASFENTGTGSLVVNGNVTWLPSISAARDFTGVPDYAILNSNTGTLAINGTITLSAPGNTSGSYTFDAINTSTGVLTLGTVSAASSGSNNHYGVLGVEGTATAGTINLAGGSFRGDVTVGATHTVNLTGAATVVGVLTNAGTIALAGNVLTLSGNQNHLTNGGTITATSNGGLVVSASGANTFDGGTLSNVTISGGGTTTFQTNAINVTNLTVSSGTLTGSIATTASGTIAVSGGTINVGNVTFTTKDFTQSSGTFTLNANAASILDVNGNFNRTAGTFTAGAASDVQFTGTVAQSLNGGPLWTVADLVFNNVDAVITLGQSVRATGAVSIAANTNVDLSTLNIILFANNASITNNGAYTAVGGGGVIFGGVNTISGAAANYTGQLIAGTGAYSYLTVDVGDANTVGMTAAQHVKFNKTLTLRSGDLDVNNGAGSFGPTGTEAKIVSYISGAAVASNVIVTAGGFNTNSPVDYDLEYTGTTTADVTVTTGTNEFDADNVRNLTVSHTSNANTVELILASAAAVTVKGDVVLTAPAAGSFTELQLPAQDVTINGALTVGAGAEISGGNAANPVALAGNSKTHTVAGTITAAGVLTVTGTGSVLNGSTVTADAATVNSLAFEPAANNATFTSNNLKVIAGNLTLVGTSTKTGTSATIALNGTTGTLTGNLAVGAGAATTASVTINGGTTSVLTGNVTLTAGALTLTRGGNSTVVGGTVTLTAGTLTLGSNVTVTGATSQVAGNIDAGGFKYIQLGSVAANDYNRTGAGTFTNGTLSLNSTAAALVVVTGATFSVPNLESVGTAGGNSATVGAMTVSNSLLLDNASPFVAGGTVTVSGNTVTVTNDAGAYTGALALTGTAATVTLAQDYTIPTLTVNTTGSVTLASDNTTARTLTVNAAYTNTKGAVSTGINNLVIANPGTFTWTAGTLTQGTGVLEWNTAGAIAIPATGFSVDNLTVSTDASVGTSAFTVVKNLVLSGDLTTSADGKLTLGDGVLVTRTDNADVLSNLPTFGANTDLLYKTYTGAVDITTAKEVPSTVRNLTVVSSDATANNADAVEVILAKNITITGTLSLEDELDATTTASVAVTMAEGSTLELKVDGTVALDENLTKLGAMYLVYNGAANTSPSELGAITAGAHPVYNGDVTFKSTVALDAITTFTGKLSFSGASNLVTTGQTVNVQGNVEQLAAATGFFAGTGSVVFNGAVNTTVALVGNESLPAFAKFEIAKTNADNTVTLSGGNLDFATAPVNITLTKGVLVTGDKTVILKQWFAAGQPTQGYVRTAGHISGNVKKLLPAVTGSPNAATILTRVEYPVGSLTYYKPMAFQFNTLPTADFNLTVKEVEATPDGTNGFPITDGSLTLASYPGFYWLVTSDLTLQPQVKYDIEAEANGYGTSEYPEGIQNVRFLRRFDTDITNPWLLQGGLGYDNSTNVDHAKVIVRSAEGAISTQGARFTYSQATKAPSLTTDLAAVTVAEGTALSVKWTAKSQNLGGTATINANPVWTATAPAVVPSNATFDAATGTLTWTPTYAQAGTYTVKVTAVDGSYSVNNTVTITVTNTNQAPSFTATGAAKLADATLPYGTMKSFTYVAVDADAEALTYAVAIAPAPKNAPTISNAFGTVGLFEWTPAYEDLGNTYVVTVTATDANAGTTTTTANLTVAAAYKKGDATMSGGEPDINDAIAILKHVVGLVTLSTEAQSYADVNTNSVIESYDATLVLKYIANNYSWTGVSKTVATAGTVEFSRLSNENGVITLPFALTATKGVNSIYAEANLNDANITVGKVNVRLPEGWLVATSTENGIVKIAAAGTTALADGIFATVELTLGNKEAVVSVVGNAVLNDDLSASLNANVREIPTEFAVSQNYPNPFNPTTSIKFSVAQDAKVSLVVYDMLGQKVRTLVNGVQEAGYYTVRWDGSNEFGSKVASGIYIYRLEAGSFVRTMKMNLLK